MNDRPGFRREANQFGMLSELKEKFPDGDYSAMTFSVTAKEGLCVKLHCWGLTRDENGEYMKAEAEMLKHVALFGPDVKWERNAPVAESYSDTYYEMTGLWHGVSGGPHAVRVTLLASRADLCERVVVMTHTEKEMVPDPELVKDIPLKEVEVVKEIVEWQCNEALSRVNL